MSSEASEISAPPRLLGPWSDGIRRKEWSTLDMFQKLAFVAVSLLTFTGSESHMIRLSNLAETPYSGTSGGGAASANATVGYTLTSREAVHKIFAALVISLLALVYHFFSEPFHAQRDNRLQGFCLSTITIFLLSQLPVELGMVGANLAGPISYIQVGLLGLVILFGAFEISRSSTSKLENIEDVRSSKYQVGDEEFEETENVLLNPAQSGDRPHLESKGVLIQENNFVGSPSQTPRRQTVVSAALSNNQHAAVEAPKRAPDNIPRGSLESGAEESQNAFSKVEPQTPLAPVLAPKLDVRPNKNHPTRTVRIGDGESLRQIAKRETGQENAWRQIAMDNNITNLKLLYVGMELKIVDRNSDSNFAVVYVHRGDTLASICDSNFGDSKLWAQVVKDNGLASASEIFVGQPIYLRRTLLQSRTPGPPPPPPLEDIS